jgi:hypothetical protein
MVASSPCLGSSWFWDTCPGGLGLRGFGSLVLTSLSTVAPCSSFPTCGACVGQSQCGWCGSSSPPQCLQGSVVSPNSAVCSAWNWDMCPGATPVGSAYWDNSVASVTLQFDLDMALSNAEQPCTAYFTNAADDFGVSPRCYWVNSKQMSVLLGPQFTAALAFNLQAGVNAGLFASLTDNAPDPAILVTPALPAQVTTPLVLVQGPSQVTLCDSSVTLDGRGSLGVAVSPTGTPAKWQWTFVSGTSSPAIVAALDAANTGNLPILEISPIDFRGFGANYTFRLGVVAYLGRNASVTHTFMVNSAPLVDVTITAPSSLVIYGTCFGLIDCTEGFPL